MPLIRHDYTWNGLRHTSSRRQKRQSHNWIRYVCRVTYSLAIAIEIFSFVCMLRASDQFHFQHTDDCDEHGDRIRCEANPKDAQEECEHF